MHSSNIVSSTGRWFVTPTLELRIFNPIFINSNASFTGKFNKSLLPFRPPISAKRSMKYGRDDHQF